MTIIGIALALAGAPVAPAQATPDIVERDAATLAADMAAGRTSAEALTRAYLARIAAIDRAGPTLRSVVALNPHAIADARARDAERRAGRVRGPLHGVPVLLKDNIETREMATTAGSLALAGNRTGRDAPLVARLRAAGVVILGKTNLSEWANIRSSASMSGWSAVGGLVRNPYALDRTACGSSSGSGAAIAASLAAIGVGTETDGSVVCPAAMNGLVGLKPGIGMVSRTHIVPISHSQDTAGPMGRSVRDVALLFAAMVGSDAADATTGGADARRRDYAAALAPDALRGLRLAVLRPTMPEALAATYDRALAVLRGAGAVLVEATLPDLPGLGDDELLVLRTELKADLNAYLATTPPSVATRTLADVIAFNTAQAPRELQFFGQDFFVAAEATKGLSDPAYRAARARSQAQAAGAIDTVLTAARAQAIVTPTYGLPWLSDPVAGDQFSGPSASQLPAVAGTPHLTVPMGLARDLPVGLSFLGRQGSEELLLRAGHGYEQAAHARVAPTYRPGVPADLDGQR